MTGPLGGIRVLDFGRLAVGPAAGMYLGQLGAEVIKVESPSGDDSRTVPPLKQGMSMVYMTVNSNKKNILLDLRAPADLEVARRLVAISDVLIENFRPGVMDRLGLGYEDLARTNPGLVYCAASGYGTRGPMRSLRSSDHFGQGIGGFVSLNGEVGGARSSSANPGSWTWRPRSGWCRVRWRRWSCGNAPGAARRWRRASWRRAWA